MTTEETAEIGDAMRMDVEIEAVSDEENERRAADVDAIDSEGRLVDAAGVIKSTPRRRR